MSKSNSWINLVKKMKAQHPNKPLKDVLKLASAKYKKRKVRGGLFAGPMKLPSSNRFQLQGYSLS